MRVTKSQIVRGVADYIKTEILPKMSEDRAMQIMASIAVNAAAKDERMISSVMSHEIVRALLDDDGSGTYEIDGLAESMRDAMEQYGAFPVKVPPIPFLSGHEITLKLNDEDVEAMRRRIENAV